MPAIKISETTVKQLKGASLGVFGYRPIPSVGTNFGTTLVTARPNALMLVKEFAFSDAPLAGFQVDQFVYKLHFGFFAPRHVGPVVKFTHINSSNSIESVGNLFEFNLHNTVLLKSGNSIYTSMMLLFENEKYSENKPRMFPIEFEAPPIRQQAQICSSMALLSNTVTSALMLSAYPQNSLTLVPAPLGAKEWTLLLQVQASTTSAHRTV